MLARSSAMPARDGIVAATTAATTATRSGESCSTNGSVAEEGTKLVGRPLRRRFENSAWCPGFGGWWRLRNVFLGGGVAHSCGLLGSLGVFRRTPFVRGRWKSAARTGICARAQEPAAVPVCDRVEPQIRGSGGTRRAELLGCVETSLRGEGRRYPRRPRCLTSPTAPSARGPAFPPGSERAALGHVSSPLGSDYSDYRPAPSTVGSATPGRQWRFSGSRPEVAHLVSHDRATHALRNEDPWLGRICG
jgi:hypothetical protein